LNPAAAAAAAAADTEAALCCAGVAPGGCELRGLGAVL
jgi:hypothetical protein